MAEDLADKTDATSVEGSIASPAFGGGLGVQVQAPTPGAGTDRCGRAGGEKSSPGVTLARTVISESSPSPVEAWVEQRRIRLDCGNWVRGATV